MATAQAPQESALGFPSKGSLRRTPFPKLMRELARQKRSGRLYLLSGQTKKVVFFEEGRPVFVRSNVLSECLGRVLSAEGLITSEQCEQTLEAIRRTGKKQGELLVEMGILSEGNLRYGLESQLRTKLFEIFTWSEGRYQFRSEDPDVPAGFTLRQSPEGIIVGAILTAYPDDRARRLLEPQAALYPRALERPDLDDAALDLLPEELYFLRCLDGSRTTVEVLDEQSSPGVPSPSALLHGALQAGLVELLEQPAARRPRPVAPRFEPPSGPDDAFRPDFEPRAEITEYEDTPLPGELPSARGLLGDHDVDFASVEDDEGHTTGTGRVEVPAELVAAEPDSIEETFDDDQIELTDEEVEIVDLVQPGPDIDDSPEPPTRLDVSAGRPLGDHGVDRTPPDGLQFDPTVSHFMDDAATELLSLDELDNVQLPDLDAPLLAASLDDVALPIERAFGELDDIDLPPVTDEELVDFDELDDVDLLGGSQPIAPDDGRPDVANSVVLRAEPDLLDGPVRYSGSEATVQDPEGNTPEMTGAIRFNEAETAMAERNYPVAVRLFEEALRHGFEVAELHAMLAYARFMSSDQDELAAQAAFVLLEYAQTMDPSLDLAFAYRGAIHRAMGDLDRAREAAGRALELNPYCELAVELLDAL